MRNRAVKGAESEANGWAAFERAVDAAVKGGPKHREKPHEEMKPVMVARKPTPSATPRKQK